MLVGVIGINHKLAGLVFRETFAKLCLSHFGASTSFHPTLSYVLLSTCNRTEIYFHSSDLAESHTYLLRVFKNALEEEFEHKLYSYFGPDCFSHLAKVTAGLDSALIGETEIQGQVKTAYERAKNSQTLPYELHFLFQKCLKIGKQIRTLHPLMGKMPTLEEAVGKSVENTLGDFRSLKILFVGLSEVNKKIYSLFRRATLAPITFCNRSTFSLNKWAEEEPIALLPWEELFSWHEYDLVIVGTKSPSYILYLSEPISHSLLIIDLCVPRNVDPTVGEDPHTTLLNIDSLNRQISHRRRRRAEEIAYIESKVIGEAVERQILYFRSRENIQKIAHF